MTKTSKQHFSKPITNLFLYVHNHIYALNSSKLFAGLMIIILNIASRFVTIKLSKTMEAYLKYTFSRQVLIFAIAWMGTRDIYIALIISIVFMFCMDYLFNEESRFCCLPESFTDYHVDLFHTNQNTGSNNQSTPGQSPQGQSTNQPTPSQSTPNQSTPNQSTPSQSTPSQSPNNQSNTNNIASSNDKISDEEIKRATAILEKAKLQNTQLQYQSFYKYNDYYNGPN